MDALNDPSVDTIVIMSSAQVGKTEIINNIAGYFIDQDPSPILLVQPTVDMAKAWSKDRLAPMLRDTPCLRGKVKDPRSRDSGNTTLHKSFPGGHITMGGANSPAGLASRPIRVVLCDEVDRYPVSAGSEGDPVRLAFKRTATFWNRKRVLTSTPTIKGASRIEMAWEESDQRRFWVPCPHCGDFQTLKWGQVTWPKDKPFAAVYACEHCGAEINDADKLRMLRDGEWRAEGEFKGVAGFHLNELYSPWRKFGDVAADFVEAKKSPETLKTWVNTSLGETWEEEGETIDETGLIARREKYPAPVPASALVLVAGVDIQADRIELEVLGVGEGEETWNIDYRVIWGDTTSAEAWRDLDAALQAPYKHESGVDFHVAAACIDSGFNTDLVYDFCRDRQARRIFAVKGQFGDGKPHVSAPSRKRYGKKQRPVVLFNLGVDEIKGLIYARFRQTEKGPGYCHFPLERDEEYFKQLTAEKIVTKYRRGFPYREWQKMRARNEALDCRVYALAAVRILNPSWPALKNRIPHQEKPKPQPKPQKQANSGWLNTSGDWL